MEKDKVLTKEEQREVIKESFRQRDTDIEVIPITKVEKELLKETTEVVNVGLYTRVSTDSLEQATSIALQEVSFEDIQRYHPNWKLVETYTDEGISGTSIKHRQAFQRMLSDAETGKLDLIVTRSVSRFARNLMDCVQTYKKLAALPHPVYVYFVSNNLITNGKGEQSEMILNFMAMIAQEESHIKSDVMNGSIEQRFGSGKFLLSECLGYDRIRASQYERPSLVINPEEAQTVRYMYGLLLAGHSCSKIANILMEEGRKTKKGNTCWSGGTVTNILQNEKYYGAIVARKTFTPNYLDHKSVKNNGERKRYRKENHHPAIVSKEVWVFAQKILESQRRRRGRQITRILSVIQTGILRGFVLVDKSWLGSNIDDYIEANRFAYPEKKEKPKEIRFGSVSNFDLSGYEAVSNVLFGERDMPTVVLDYNTIRFNRRAFAKMDMTEQIELLFNPKTFELAVRPASRDSKTSLKWGYSNNGNFVSYRVSVGSFTNILFDYMQWNETYKYKIFGQSREHNGENLLFFSLRDIEVSVPVVTGLNDKVKYAKYYPQIYVNQYGEDAYQSIYTTRSYLLDYFKVWDACVGSVAVKEDELEEKMRKASKELLNNKEF